MPTLHEPSPAADEYLSGAHKILSQCLSLEEGDNLLVFCDETTLPVVEYVTQAARDSDIEYAILFEPTSQQPLHVPNEAFPLFIQSALDHTSAILNCVCDRTECLPYRKRIIGNGQGAARRIGHMPGVDLVTLAFADADYVQIQRDCADLAIALAKGRNVQIVTTDSAGKQHFLEANIGGWDQIPIASDGIIQRGAWGNIPGGETYIAPILGTAQGSIVIKTALPNLPLDQSDQAKGISEIVLRFQGGCLIDYQTESDEVRKVLEEQRQYAESHNDKNWRFLAEIGLGVNKSIRKATGVSLIDEKMYGTVHIAIGDNASHGGNNRSAIHCDMITVGRVEVDNKAIVDSGALCFNPAEWYEHVPLPDHDEESLSEFTFRYSGGEYALEKRCLYRIWSNGAGRPLRVPVGDPASAQLSARVFNHIVHGRNYVTLETLVTHTGLKPNTVAQIALLLQAYRLIEFESVQ